ncbi:hypothetical protein M7I_5013 [Glarea lozoyensis 74030]|uniref:Uncharacterized protein n=1 Tax=Glarea lozoyensis (strain ATCC 74030 / MF5533) TaxID=1104152 RepID=H0EQQ8_GLAL7|nr:hypothetical protein M7I_5013 [Glarea lozoyensis 74030]
MRRYFWPFYRIQHRFSHLRSSLRRAKSGYQLLEKAISVQDEFSLAVS